jgi:hypothetical protein
MGILHKEKRMYKTILRRILLTKRNFSERICREKVFWLKYFFPEIVPFMSKMFKNVVQSDTEHLYSTAHALAY